MFIVTDSQQSRAVVLRELHKDGVLVLPNAWDAGSAALIARAGVKAIATTSGGVSWSQGKPDQQALSRDEMVEQVRRIAAAVELPVTADVEGGYGPAPEDVAATVEAVIAAGAVGINLEDSKPDFTLFSADEQAERIRAARAAAERAGLPELVVNLRTDVFLFGIGEEAGRADDVLARAAVYAEAGADGLFVPGLLDLAVIAELVEGQPLPVNVMAGPGGADGGRVRGGRGPPGERGHRRGAGRVHAGAARGRGAGDPRQLQRAGRGAGLRHGERRLQPLTRRTVGRRPAGGPVDDRVG
ncbi:hypothetical protein GCM10020229_69770 [Kitasatospora albolonga]